MTTADLVISVGAIGGAGWLILRAMNQTATAATGDVSTPDLGTPTVPTIPTLPDLPTPDLSVSSGVDPIDRFAHAIAFAEGYGVDGAAPTRANNPGSLKQPWLNYATTGAEGITVYPSPDDGWNALRAQLQLIVDNQSQVYELTDTIGDMARKWTDTDGANWAANVVFYLNGTGLSVGSDTPLSAVLT